MIRDLLDPVDLLDLLGHQEQRDLPAVQAIAVAADRLVPVEQVVTRDQLVLRVLPDRQDRVDQVDLLDHRDEPDLPAEPDPRDPLV